MDSSCPNCGYVAQLSPKEKRALEREIEGLKSDREMAIKSLLDAGMSTGHGDTFTDVVNEVIADIDELRALNAL